MISGIRILPQATEALRITAPELVRFGVMDGVIEEPLGAAHSDPMGSFPAIRTAILGIYNSKSGPTFLPVALLGSVSAAAQGLPFIICRATLGASASLPPQDSINAHATPALISRLLLGEHVSVVFACVPETYTEI